MSRDGEVRWRAIVTLEPGGKPLRLGRSHHAITSAEHASGQIQVLPGLVGDLDLPPISSGRGGGEGWASITAALEIVPAVAMRAAGLWLDGAPAELALWRVGDDWSARRVLLVGRVMPGTVEVSPSEGTVRMQLGDFGERDDSPFPPHAVTRELFSTADEGILGESIPVLYGDCKDVPALQLSLDEPNATVIRYALASHRIASGSVLLRPNGQAGGAEVSAAVSYGTAGPVRYAYVEVTPTQVGGATSVVFDARGMLGSDGYPVMRLGDVVDHALRTYSRVDSARLDDDRLSRFRARANRITVASVFGGSQGDTLLSLLKGRYEPVFPVAIGWRGGRLGADYTGWDALWDAPAGPTLQLGRNLLERVDPVTYACEDGEMPRTSFTLEYEPKAYGRDSENRPAFRYSLTYDELTDNRCKSAFTRFGRAAFPPVQAVDCNSSSGFAATLDSIVERYAVVRARVTYLAYLDEVIDLLPLERHALTDEDMGWSGEPFRLDEIRPREDDLAEIVLSSLGEL